MRNILQPFAQRHFVLRSPIPASRTFAPARQLKTTSRRQGEAKDDPAFSPEETRPEEQGERAADATAKDGGYGGGQSATPGVNPAHPAPSQPRSPQEGGSQGSQSEEGGGGFQRSGPSGGGSPNKAGGGKSG